MQKTFRGRCTTSSGRHVPRRCNGRLDVTPQRNKVVAYACRSNAAMILQICSTTLSSAPCRLHTFVGHQSPEATLTRLNSSIRGRSNPTT